MARVLWKDRIGETKEVQGFVFTIVDNEGDRVVVEVADDLHIMSRATWRNGKFTKILRVLKPKFLGDQVKINDILFTVIEAAKEYVRIIAEGYEGEEIITTSRWKRAKFATKKFMQGFKRVMVNCMDLIITSFKGTRKTIKANSEELHDLKHTYDLGLLKKVYRKLVQKFHPDHGGNAEMFKLTNTIYNIRKDAIAFNEDFIGDEDFQDIVDMTEVALKAKNGVQY